MIRILHFSDVHVQEAFSALPRREVLNKRLLASANLFLTRGKLFREVLQKLAALGRFANKEDVGLGLCTGDYTAVGGEAELVSAKKAIEPFASLPLGLVTVPGNHDLYLPDTLRDLRFDRHFGDFLGSDLPELATDGFFPFVRLFGEDLAIIGINSAKPNPNPFSSTGRVSSKQRQGLAAALEHPRVKPRFVIVMTHYGILRHDGRPDTAHHGLEDASSLMALVERPRLMFVHGHIHHRYCHTPASGRPWLFCAGSATQRGREGAWVYEFEAGRMRAIPVGYTGSDYQLQPDHAVQVG